MSPADAPGGGGGNQAARVRALRARLGITQEQLATRLGVSFVTVNRWEKGRSRMSAAAMRRLAYLEEADLPEHPLPGTPPIPLSSFVGREREIAALTHMLAACRQVSLVGPGGSGKTRLALETLRQLPGDRPGRPHGDLPASVPGGTDPGRVVFVAMDMISDAALVGTRVAAALGLRDRPGAPAAEAVTRSLATWPAWLVLDGAEHVLAGVAQLVERVLAGAPAARVVVTSRCVLGVAGEQVWPVPVMCCPPAGAPFSTITRSDAVRLFAARAAERLPGFEITAKLARPVAELCRRLDGLPLAVELAASWVGTLSIQEILDRRSDLFGPAPSGGDSAHTLRAVAESSNAMLGTGERAVLQDLSVFAGWFTLADAAAITGVDAARLVHTLRRLVGTSWLVARSDREESAYRMLDTLREYAAGRLEAAGQAHLARARHAAYFTAVASASEQALVGPGRAGVVNRLERATADLDAALTWADAAGETTVGRQLSAALWRWWLTTGRLAEGRRWLAVFLADAAGASGDATLARAWLAAAALAAENGDYRPAIEQASRALRAFDAAGADDLAAKAATVLGSAYRYVGNHGQARRHFELAVARRRRLGDEAGIAAALNNLALTAVDAGEFGRARRLYEEALALKRKLGNARSVAITCANLGEVLVKTHHAGDAERMLAEAAALAAGLGDIQLDGIVACNKGDLARMEEDFAAAGRHYRRALDMFPRERQPALHRAGPVRRGRSAAPPGAAGQGRGAAAGGRGARCRCGEQLPDARRAGRARGDRGAGAGAAA